MPRRIGDHWYSDFRFKKQRIRRVLPDARTQDQAKRAEARMRDQFFEGSYGDPAAAHTFIEFARTVWLPYSKAHKRSHRCDLRHFQTFREYFQHKTFADITSLTIEKFKRDRLKTLKPASVNRELAALSKIFSLAIQQKVTSDNPCRQVKKLIENNARTRFLTRDEEARLFDALLLNPTMTTIVTIAIHTGMRKGEILKLEWRDVDFQAENIHVRDTKSGHDRFVPMNAVVAKELKQITHHKADKFVFPSDGKTGHLVEIKKAWATALKIAGIQNFHFHDLRHTAGSRFAATGAHPTTIKELLGHQQLSTTERYMHAADEAKRAAVAALENFGKENNDEVPTRNLRLVK